MPDIVSCPECSKKLRVPEDLLGKDVKCPSCGAMFRARLEEAGPPPVPPAAEPMGQDRVEEEPRAPRRAASAGRARDDWDDDDDSDDDYDDRPRRRRRRLDYAPHRGGVVLALGILSLVMCGLFTGIPAWVMGNSDLAAMRARRMDPSGESTTNAGRICGIIGTCLSLLGCMIYAFIFLMIGIGGAARR